jgi:hypothetical protein
VPTLTRFQGIKITMYFRDHNPPHFHAAYAGQKAELLLNGAVKTGSLPPAQLGLVQEWASQHQQALISRWNLAAAGRHFTPID